jgi:DNA helicase-2/ATP-dependent DNA helicase PcrA
MTRRYNLKRPARQTPDAKRYEKALNQQQYAAVTASNSPILVIAGAGSGKTRTITYRVAWLLDQGVKPHRIMLVTFTNKAAKEMLHRVEHLVSSDARRIWGGTFHHIGNAILRRYAPVLGYSNNYTILDREDSRELFHVCMGEAGVKKQKKRFPTAQVLANVAGFSVSSGLPLKQVVANRYPAFADQIADVERIVALYQKRKRKLDAMDFDDLLVNWRKVLLEREDIRLQ